MRTWVWMLSGLIVWSAHFLGVYLISSVADVVATADDPVWRLGGLAFSGVCLLSAAAVLWFGVRRLRLGGERGRFADQLAALGACIAMLAIFWQSLPIVIGF